MSTIKKFHLVNKEYYYDRAQNTSECDYCKEYHTIYIHHIFFNTFL